MHNQFEQLAAETRLRIFQAIMAAGKGHIGGALSCVDILVALYDGGIMNITPQTLKDPCRDRFIMSKGHAGVALYCVLSRNGFFADSEIDSMGRGGSMLGEHPDHFIPGVEVSSGSLGHGLAIGAGIAKAAKLDGLPYRTFVLMGDGECHEGSVWEAAMVAAHHRLDNLVAIVDRNGQITLDYTEDCLALEPLDAKFSAFGWQVIQVDGHDMNALLESLAAAKSANAGKPIAIIAKTIKGKGVSFMEGSLKWHHGMPSQGEGKFIFDELTKQTKIL